MTLNPAPTFLWRIEVRVPAAARDAFEAALEPFCIALTSMVKDPDKPDGAWLLEGFASAEPDQQAIRRAFDKAANEVGMEPAPKPKIVWCHPGTGWRKT